MLITDFNSRPHEEVDQHNYCRGNEIFYFNSRPHEEVDGWQISSILATMYFNSRPHEEVDLHCGGVVTVNLPFQLTTSRRGRLPWLPFSPLRTYFNSRPHEEVDPRIVLWHPLKLSISTHDLTKRSTHDFLQRFPITGISTHDLTKRSTRLSEEIEQWIDISTHDLTKRSTLLCRNTCCVCRYFNSRPHEEVDTS